MCWVQLGSAEPLKGGTEKNTIYVHGLEMTEGPNGEVFTSTPTPIDSATLNDDGHYVRESVSNVRPSFGIGMVSISNAPTDKDAKALPRLVFSTIYDACGDITPLQSRLTPLILQPRPFKLNSGFFLGQPITNPPNSLPLLKAK